MSQVFYEKAAELYPYSSNTESLDRHYREGLRSAFVNGCKFTQFKLEDFTRDEVRDLVHKVHEYQEGRYELDGLDVYNIHAILADISNLMIDEDE